MNAFGFEAWQGSPLWRAAGEAMLDFLITGTAAAVVFLLLRRVVGGLSASVRYGVACGAMLTLVGLAGFHAWDHWPALADTAAVAVANTAPEAVFFDTVSSSVESAPWMPAPAVVAAPAVEESLSWEAWKPRVIAGLPAFWLFGAPLTALFVGLGWTGAARLRRQSVPLLDSALLARFERCRAILRVKNVALAVCDRIASPIVVGVLRPVILLPPSLLTSLTCEQWEMILMHELAHVRRLDNLVNLLQRGVETLLFFHPAVWWASRWMRLEREHCCDAVVLNLGTALQAYAETLAVLALPGIAPHLATAAMANHELLTRMRHILGTEDLTMTVSWKKLGLAAVVFAAVGGVVATDWSGPTQRAEAEERASLLERPVGTGPRLNLIGRDKLAWSAAQATGAPDVPNYSDHPNAWAAAEPDKQGEWLEVYFEGAPRAAAVVIRESFNAGAISRVEIRSVDPMITHDQGFRPKLYRSNGGAGEPAPRMTLVPVIGFERTESVRIEIEEPAVPGWNEIDAVGLIDLETGEVHWATSAKASSSFADRSEPRDHRFYIGGSGALSSDVPSWHPRQATGAPNVPQAGDDGRAWASSPQDGQQEWLELTYDPPVDARQLLVYESFNPGALTHVLVQQDYVRSRGGRSGPILADGSLEDGWRSIWPGRDSVRAADKKGVATIQIPPTVRNTGRVAKVLLFLDSSSVPGWNEIDAVGLLDAETGQVQWASDAKASSWFGQLTLQGISQDTGFPDSLLSNAPGTAANPLQFTGLPIIQSPNWSAAQATGAPNVHQAGDDTRAWASATQDGQKEWLELTYEPPALASAIVVYESFNPGAVSEVHIEEVDPDPSALPASSDSFRVLWKDAPWGVQNRNGLGVNWFPVKTNIKAVRKVRLLIDSPKVPGWNEIDAVGLLTLQGQMQWAAGAKASSEYGQAEGHVSSKTSTQVETVAATLPALTRPATAVRFDLDREGSIRANGDLVSAAALRGWLKQVEADSETVVHIRADKRCPYQALKNVFDASRDSGLSRLKLTRVDGAAGKSDSTANDANADSVVPLFELVTNLNEKQPHFLRLKMQLLVESTKASLLGAEIERQQTVLKDRLLEQTRDKTVDELRGSAGLQLLKVEMLSTIRSVLPAEHGQAISDLLFEEVMVQ